MSRMLATAIVSLGVALAVAGCGDDNDQKAMPTTKVGRFAELARAVAPAAFGKNSDAEMKALGDQICGSLDDGVPYATLVGTFAQQRLSEYQSYVVMSTAVAALCPRNKSKLPSESPPPP